MTAETKNKEQYALEKININKIFGGWHKQFSHYSNSLKCTMHFTIFLPPQIKQRKKVPVLYWLSGLTCTDENFMQKSGVQRIAAELGIAIVAPDTSPRGGNIPDETNQSYDLGLGAGFYVNATQKPWCEHYQMYSYIVDELPKIIEENFAVNQQRAISGHSMGGHGALTIALKNPHRYSSVSAFSPICNPINSPWGEKAFQSYLGENKQTWLAYDSVELLKKSTCMLPILVDQGKKDNFLTEQLKPETLLLAAKINNQPLTLRMQDGYDHSYYFIASFIEDHIRFHAKYILP